MENKSNFIKGFVEIITLYLLSKEDGYGMKLVNEIREKSDGKINLSVGTLYPTLYKLEEGGCITNYKKVVGKRKTMVYYHITEVGEQKLNSLLNDYNSLIKCINAILDF